MLRTAWALVFIVLASVASLFAQPIYSKSHPGVSFDLDRDALNDYRRERFRSPDWNGWPDPDHIKGALRARFEEAVDTYLSAKSTLPSCLRITMDMYLEERRVGSGVLVVDWTNWLLVPPKTPTGPWGQGTKISFPAAGVWQFLPTNGHAWNERLITIEVAFHLMRFCHVSNTGVSTSSLLFHEMLHAAWKEHPYRCLRLPHSTLEGELVVDDATNRVFGQQNNCASYRIANPNAYPNAAATEAYLCIP